MEEKDALHLVAAINSVPTRQKMNSIQREAEDKTAFINQAYLNLAHGNLDFMRFIEVGVR